MQEIFLPDVPMEQREQLMRDNCDEVVEKSYTRRYTQAEINKVRAELADGFIELNELQGELDVIKAEFKGKMKPIQEKNSQLIHNLKSGGEFVTTECIQLVSVLKNFTAKCQSEIQKMRDPSGSVAEVYRNNVESNLPQSFVVSMPIFKGTAKETIEVEFDHYLRDSSVMLQLVSPGANEVTESYRDRIIDSTLAEIREVAPEIAILEK